MILTFVKIRWMSMCTIPSIKLQNLCEEKMHFAHHRMPNCIYACILPHTRVENLLKEPEYCFF